MRLPGLDAPLHLAHRSFKRHLAECDASTPQKKVRLTKPLSPTSLDRGSTREDQQQEEVAGASRTLSSRGLDLLAAAAEWGLIIRGRPEAEGRKGHRRGGQQHQETVESCSTEATESDDDTPSPARCSHGQASGLVVPAFVSKGIEALGPPPWSYESLLEFMGVPLTEASDPRHAAAAQVAAQVVAAQPGGPSCAPAIKHGRCRHHVVVTTSGGPQDGAAAAAAPDGVHDPGQGVEGAGAKTGAAHHGRLLGAPQDTRAPAQGCDGDEAPKGECVKVLYGCGGARLADGRIYMPLAIVTNNLHDAVFPLQVRADVFVNGERIAHDHEVVIKRAINNTRANGLGNHFISGHQRLLNKYKGTRLTCLELLSPCHRLRIHVSAQGTWDARPLPQLPLQPTAVEGQASPEPTCAAGADAAAAAAAALLPAPRMERSMQDQQQPQPPRHQQQQQQPPASIALQPTDPIPTPSCAPNPVAAPLGAQHQPPLLKSDPSSFPPLQAGCAPTLPLATGSDSLGMQQQHPGLNLGSLDALSSLSALSTLSTLSTLNSSLSGTSTPGAIMNLGLPPHGMGSSHGSSSLAPGLDVPGMLGLPNFDATTSLSQAYSSGGPMAATAPLPAAAPAPVAGPRLYDGRVHVPLQIIHDHYSDVEFPVPIRAHVFINNTLLASSVAARMVRYKKSANRANHFCTGLQKLLARYNDLRLHRVEQDADGCLRVSLLAAP